MWYEVDERWYKAAMRPSPSRAEERARAGRKKRALVLDQPGLPWVWSECLEGIFKNSPLVKDICVGFDGPAIWGGETKNPPWVFALVCPTMRLEFSGPLSRKRLVFSIQAL